MKDDASKDAPGRQGRAQGTLADVSKDAAESTGNGSAWKGFSGHFDTRPPSGRVKRRAQELSQWEFGDGNDWEDFVKEAEGDVRWENFEEYLKKRGWKFFNRYDYDRPDGGTLYQAHRYNYALYPSKKRVYLRHRVGGHEPWTYGAGPV